MKKEIYVRSVWPKISDDDPIEEVTDYGELVEFQEGDYEVGREYTVGGVSEKGSKVRSEHDKFPNSAYVGIEKGIRKYVPPYLY